MNNEIKEQSIKVQKGFVSETKEIIVKENLIETLNRNIVEFNENPEYGTFKTIKDTVLEIESYIKEAVMSLLVENGLKSSEGPAGTFTLAERKTLEYVESNEIEKDPRVVEMQKLKEEIKSLEEEIKKDVILFGKDVPGAVVKTTPYVRFSAAKNKGEVIAVDFVDGEKA